jgi:hypothetical protein
MTMKQPFNPGTSPMVGNPSALSPNAPAQTCFHSGSTARLAGQPFFATHD